MRYAKFIVALAAALAFPPAVPAAMAQQPSGRIEGRVQVEGDTTGVAGAVVRVEGTGRSALTDANGYYRITGVPEGARAVTARRLGYEPARQNVTVTASGSVPVGFALRQAALVLNDIVVSAAREEERRVEIPVAIGVIDGGLLRAVKPAHPAEIMNKVAGVWVNVTGGEGHMTAIRQPITTDPVYLFLEDGIPSRSTGFFNHNALYEINLPQADRIEVSKGPANALYGSDAIGGVVNVSTRAPSKSPELSLSAEGGQYTWGRALASASNTWRSTGLRADLNYTRTDGWRDATDYNRKAGTVRWDQAIGSSTRMKTLATFSVIDQQTAGTSAISLNDYISNPTINYTPISLRAVKAFRVSTAIDKGGARGLFSVTPYFRYDWMRLLPNWSLTYDAQDYTTSNSSVGALVKYRYDFDPMRTRVIVGADGDFSPGRQWEHTLSATRTNGIFTSYTQGALIYDYDVSYYGVSPYVQVETSPTSRFRVTGGIRYDHTGYDYSTRLPALAGGRWRRPGDTTVTYGHVSPKIGATYEFHEAFNIFASYRHGFRAPSQGQLFRQGSSLNTVGLQPVRANNYEVGARGRFGRRVEYDLSLYSLVKNDDILSYTLSPAEAAAIGVPAGATQVVNAGRTSHRGIEASIGVQVVEPLRVDLAYSYAKHTYEAWAPSSTVNLSGNEMANAPRHMGNGTLTIAPPKLNGAQVSFQWTLIGSYWQDPADTFQYGGHNLLNARATFPIAQHITLSARLMNITNRRYAETSSWTAARGQEFAPGLPRAIYAGVQYDLR